MDDYLFFVLWQILSDIVCAILLSISFGLVYFNPTKIIGPFLRLFTPKSSQVESLDILNEKIVQIKLQMSELSPTADFAKYYKLERSLNKLKEEKDKLDKIIVSNSFKTSVKIEIASRIIFMIISSILMWNAKFFVLLKIDRRWFYPLTNNFFNFFEGKQQDLYQNVTLFSFVLLGIIVKKVWDYRTNDNFNFNFINKIMN